MLINQGIQRRIATFEKANLDEDAGAGGAGTEGASIAKTFDPAALGLRGVALRIRTKIDSVIRERMNGISDNCQIYAMGGLSHAMVRLDSCYGEA